MSNLKVLVVGASIAGPTAAYWFAKIGASVTVIERFPALRTGGQNIDIRTTGVTVMRKMHGMEAAVRAKLVPMEGMSFVRDDGTRFATMRASGDPNQQALLSEYEIFRGDLARILFDMTKDNDRIKYVFGEQVASMQQKEGSPITVEFANGYPTADYDLVVACDGATSRTRAMGLGCGVRDHIISSNCWGAHFSVKKDLLNGSKYAQGNTWPGGRFFTLMADPSGATRVGLMSIKPRNDQDLTLPFREAAKQGDTALRQYVAKQFDGIGWKAREAFDNIMQADDFYASEIVQVKVPSLYKGRFVMVGDAGCCPSFTGTGTSLAIGGAYVLAGEIGRHKGDLAAGLKAYEDRMKPIIEDMQQIPPGIPGLLAPQTAWGVWLRNTVVTFVCWASVLSPFFSWIGGFWASSFGRDKYGLPDYEWEA